MADGYGLEPKQMKRKSITKIILELILGILGLIWCIIGVVICLCIIFPLTLFIPLTLDFKYHDGKMVEGWNIKWKLKQYDMFRGLFK